MLGDFLYRLTPRDEQVLPIQLVRKTAAWSAAAGATFTARFLPSRGSCFVVTNITAFLQPGGAMGARSVLGTIAEQVTNVPRAAIFGTEYDSTLLAVERIFERSYTPGSILIDGRDEQLQIEMNFVGAGTNTTQCWVSGYIIPIGIIALGDVVRIQVP